MMNELVHTDSPIATLGPFVEGEAPGVHQHTYLNADGDPIDITGLTVVWGQARISELTAGLETISGTIADGTGGVAQVNFGPDAWDVPGTYYGRLWVHDGVDFASRTIAYASPLFQIIVKADPLPTPT